MKLIVEGQLGVYDVTVGRGTYSITDKNTNRVWHTTAVGLPSDESAARLAIHRINAQDGPVTVHCDSPSFMRKLEKELPA